MRSVALVCQVVTLCASFETLLQVKSNDSAMDSAWSQVLSAAGEPDEIGAIPTASERRYWFLGFVEGQLRVAPPEFWAEAILSATVREESRDLIRVVFFTFRR